MKKLFKELSKIIGKDVYDNNKDVNMNLIYITSRYKLPEWFIEKSKYEKYFNFIVQNQVLSEEFIRLELNNLLNNHSFSLIAEQKIPEDIIENNIDKIPILELSEHQILSWNFIEKHKNIINWSYVSRYQPFIDYEKSIKYSKSIDKTINIIPYLNNNFLYREYKKGKDWFVGYTFMGDLERLKKYIFQPELISSYLDDYQIVKVKVYWDDLITTDLAKNVEPIRIIKLPK